MGGAEGLTQTRKGDTSRHDTLALRSEIPFLQDAFTTTVVKVTRYTGE